MESTTVTDVPALPASAAAEATTLAPERLDELLASVSLHSDPVTLQRRASDPSLPRRAAAQATVELAQATGHAARAHLFGVRAIAYRLVGEHASALADARASLEHAEATGGLRRIALAQARLATVHVACAAEAEAARLFASADHPELPAPLRAWFQYEAAWGALTAGRYLEACQHCDRALELSGYHDQQLIMLVDTVLGLVEQRATKGFGPPPRPRHELLGETPAPEPVFHVMWRRWGYAEAGTAVTQPLWEHAQPFRSGVAWVQAPGVTTWQLITVEGQVVIPASAGWLDVTPFSDGVAWVRSETSDGWVGITRDGSRAIPIGYDDVRAFHNGVAAVYRRGAGWGAVDSTGKVILACTYDAFRTAFADGRYLEGFSDEGLAVVQRDGACGVVDKAGRSHVPPRYPDLVIHPMAYLVRSHDHRWGAVDRHGETLLTPTYASRDELLAPLDAVIQLPRPLL